MWNMNGLEGVVNELDGATEAFHRAIAHFDSAIGAWVDFICDCEDIIWKCEFSTMLMELEDEVKNSLLRSSYGLVLSK
jgi:hypothetical protein